MMVPVPRSLKLFWGGVVLVVLVTAAYLQYLGPLKRPATLPPRQADGAIPAPSALLLAPSSVDAAWKIPHPGPYGITPMKYYAARAPDRQTETQTASQTKPQIAIMVAGLGEALAPSLAAVKNLPPAVSLALTPYGGHDAVIAAAARKAGHETLLGLPMQTNGEPDITEGDEALHAGAAPEDNLKQLDWSLSRLQGYAGVTDAIGMNVSETFLAHHAAASWLAGRLAASGVFFVDATPGAPPPSGVTGRAADIIIDPEDGAAAMTARLDQLVSAAIAKGSAIGVVTAPTRAGIATLATWLRAGPRQHFALVPVSVLADPAARGEEQ